MKTTLLIALLSILSLVATACGSDVEATVTGDADPIVDVSQNAIGDGVSVEQTAEETASGSRNRIVSLSPTATEMLFAIGAGDQVIAVDAFSYYPEEAPVTDLSGFVPNVEAIAGFEPTVVVSESPIEGLDAIDIENLVQLAAVTFDDVYSQIEQLGALTGNVGEAAELVLEMQTDIDVVLASLPERETPLTYYHELDNTLYSVTSTTFVGEVYSLLGLVNAADAADPDGEFFGYPQLNEEFLVTADPDIIFLADTLCCAQSTETVADRPGWDQLSAVQSGNVVELNDDIVSRWGPRLVDFIETAGAAVASVEAVPAG